MDAFRRLLASAKSGQVEITDHVSQVIRRPEYLISGNPRLMYRYLLFFKKHIQDDFVRERQRDKTISPEDLMTRMSIARWVRVLIARSLFRLFNVLIFRFPSFAALLRYQVAGAVAPQPCFDY